MRKVTLSAVAVASLLSGSLCTVASANEGFGIFDNVKFNGELRPRYEYAEVSDNGKDAANAFTTRTTLGVNAGLFGVENLSSYLEVTSVNNFGSYNYNGLSSGDAAYDVVADPRQARMTQAYVDYKAADTLVRAGRQMVNLDNQRFVGAVGWRQMFQTFDAIAVVNSSVPNLNLLAAYVYGINGIVEQPDDKATETASVLLHVSYKVMDELSVTGYGYLLADISDTYGLALTGNVDAGAAKIDYRAEYAIQSDATMEYDLKDIKADASYLNVDAGANISGILAGVNYELLSGTNGTDGKTAFQTPLATKHKFNGWADKFLATPSGGLEDINVRVGYKAKDFGKVLAVYHMFTAQEAMGGVDDLGSEFDAVYTNKIPGVKGLSGLVKAAYFQGGDVAGFTLDTTKFWVQLDYKFTSN